MLREERAIHQGRELEAAYMRRIGKLERRITELEVGLRVIRKAYMEYCDDDNAHLLACAFDETEAV